MAESQARRTQLFRCLPVTNAAIRVEDSLWHFLLEWVFENFIFVDFDTQPRTRIGRHGPSRRIHNESFINDIIPPRHVIVYRFADYVAWLRKSEFQ